MASTPELDLGVKFAGFTSFISREGLFKLVVSGTGTLWYGAFGGIVERRIDGEYIADTGHLVFSTLHTLDAKETINRIIAQFPTDEQNRVRISLGGVLQGVISQRLVPAKDGTRRAALEVLVRTPFIEKLIMEGRDVEIRDAIEAGKEHYGSQSFDQAIFDLYSDGIISKEAAMEYATSASDLELRISGLTSGKISGKSADDFTNGNHTEISADDDVFDLK
ncbi:MAG: AIM24 family protein [Sulfurimonas sp.]